MAGQPWLLELTLGSFCPSLSRFCQYQAFLQVVKELNDLAGQREVVAENLTTCICVELSKYIQELKQERKAVGGSLGLGGWDNPLVLCWDLGEDVGGWTPREVVRFSSLEGLVGRLEKCWVRGDLGVARCVHCWGSLLGLLSFGGWLDGALYPPH